ATASRQDPPCTTPDELAKAVAAMPRIRPPEPEFPPAPEYQRTTYQQGTYGRPQPHPGAAVTQPVLTPPAPLESRTGKALKWAVSALLIAALGLGSWQIADRLLDQSGTNDDPGTTQPSPSPSLDDKAAPQLRPLRIVEAREYTPGGSGIQLRQVGNAIDGDPESAWITPEYHGYANFGNLPNRQGGSGIVVDLGSEQNVSAIRVSQYRTGQTLQLRAGGEAAMGSSSLTDFPQELTPLKRADGDVDVKLDKPVRARYVLVHITELPPDGSPDRFRGGISEVQVLG
ncbi:discoidin domain-containing protein, partial [Streptomyces sp. NPDC003090]|uniref:discoidin domain-containing protein n=1 Tax=Streptomyces sp. NPDC003090 TaxID=3154274 RepID=UPI00381296AB